MKSVYSVVWTGDLNKAVCDWELKVKRQRAPQPIKEFPTVYAAQRFITILTTAYHLYLT
jgi:hypothetical protein